MALPILAVRPCLVALTATQVDDKLMELWLEGQPISGEDLNAAMRRATIAQKFIPVLMGAAFKNKGRVLLFDPRPLNFTLYSLFFAPSLTSSPQSPHSTSLVHCLTLL